MAGWSKDLQLATAQSRIGKIPRSATGLGREVAEAAQRMRDEQCRALADATSDLIFCLDKDLNLTEVNRSAARSLGLSSQEAIGRNIAELGLPPETMRRWKEKCHGVLASGQAAERLLNEFILADGVTHLNETSLADSQRGRSGRGSAWGNS